MKRFFSIVKLIPLKHFIIILLAVLGMSSCKPKQENYSLPVAALCATAQLSDGRVITCYRQCDLNGTGGTIDIPTSFTSTQYDGTVYVGRRYFYEGGSGMVKLSICHNTVTEPVLVDTSNTIIDNTGALWFIASTVTK